MSKATGKDEPVKSAHDAIVPGNTSIGNKTLRLFSFGLVLLLLLFHGGQAFAGEHDVIDPSGGWNSGIGVLSLQLTGDALSFSYSAVFGPRAHICDGAGTAGLDGQGRYEYTDDQGTVAFLIQEDRIQMEPVVGVAGFCGAGWAGDIFSRDGFQPLSKCKVIKERTHFHVVGPFPPEKRKAYVIKGDSVKVAPVRNEGGDDWVLARFKGAKITTVGLLNRLDLECE